MTEERIDAVKVSWDTHRRRQRVVYARRGRPLRLLPSRLRGRMMLSRDKYSRHRIIPFDGRHRLCEVQLGSYGVV